MKTIKDLFKNYFITGILALVPIAVTIWFVLGLISWLDEMFSLAQWTGVNIPGLGVLLALVLILVSGALARNLVGTWINESFTRSLQSLPVVGGVYKSLRQMMSTFFSTEGRKLGAAVLVQYPLPGSWTIGFVTLDRAPPEVASKLGSDHVSVFVPTTPNPTSGFFLFVKKTDVRPLDVPVDRALKTLISLGMTSPADGN